MIEEPALREEELTPGQRALARDHIGVVDDVIFRHFARLSTASLPYLRSLAAPGLLKAAKSYDATKGAQFRTYAWKAIRGAIRDGLRRDRPCANELVEKGVLTADEYAAWQTEASDPTEEAAEARFTNALLGYGAAWTTGWIFGGRTDDPEALLQQGARDRAEGELEEVWKSLRERDQRVRELRDGQGLSWPEVATAMDRSLATVQRYYHDAMGRLGERLAEKFGPAQEA